MVTKYTKKQLLKSKRYSNRRDVLTALLDDDKAYSLDEVDKKVAKFMKGKVN